MTNVESFDQGTIKDLEDAGFSYCGDHPHLAGHWRLYEDESVRVSQVGPEGVRHVTLVRAAYDHASRADFEELGWLELRQAPN